MQLRKLEMRDAPLMLEWMHDEGVVENLNTDFASKSLCDCEAFIKDSVNDIGNIHLAIVNDADEYMGTVSLKHIQDNTAEFGIAIRTVAMGKGYSKEAMKEILKLAFNERKLGSVYWCVDPKNQRALRFYDKNGYKRISFDNLKIKCQYSEEQFLRFVWYKAERNSFQ